MNFEELHGLIVEWAKARKIIPNSTPETQLLKSMSELGELADAMAKGDRDGVADGLGDVMVTLVMVAELSGLDLIECLAGAYGEIKDRRGTMLPNGLFVKEVL